MNNYISTTKDLINLVKKFSKETFVAIDTEFIREKYYYPKLCLIQISSQKESYIIDPLSKEIKLDIFWSIIYNNKITKVMHSCRQDLEIFLNINGRLPKQIFDTQIAAMVCGYGDQIGYDKLVKSLINIDIDKSSRTSDWSVRPLNQNQISYAIDDVKFLAKIYPLIKSELSKTNREKWIKDEMSDLSLKKNYQVLPENAWEKIKLRTFNRELINRVKFLAMWREITAKEKNLPKNFLLKDEIILEIAYQNPKTKNEFLKIRGFTEKKFKLIDEISIYLFKANEIPKEEWPKNKSIMRKKSASPAIVDLLKTLLKYKSEVYKVAPKLIAVVFSGEVLSKEV